MKTWTLIDTARIPGEGSELRLLRRDGEFSIRLDQGELMNSRVRGSEEALASLACAKMATRERPRILVGGLGMGFTLRAALGLLGAEAQVVVAELIPAVVSWGRGPLAQLFGDSLNDPRVTIYEGDVGRLIRSQPSAYDAILLDVDNGPDGLTHERNNGLYNPEGLRAAAIALRAGGVFAVWSAAPDPAFTSRLRKTGFSVDEVPVRANGRRGARHIIWIAAREDRNA